MVAKGGRAVRAASKDEPNSARLARIAERFGKQVVFVEGLKYDAAERGGRVKSGFARGKVVEATVQVPQLARVNELAARFDKRVIWVEGLGTDGVAHGDVIFLDPNSGRHTQVLAAHELAHTLA